MNLSSREKMLLYLLIVCSILAAGYFLLIKPKLDTLDQMAFDETNLRTELGSVEVEIASIPIVEQEIEELESQVEELTEIFYPEILVDKIILILDDIFLKSGVINNTINIGVPSAQNVLQVAFSPAESLSYSIREYAYDYLSLKMSVPVDQGQTSTGGATSSVTQENRKIEAITVKFQITGTYEQIIEFLNQIEQLEKSIIVSNLILMTAEEDEVSASVDIIFHAVAKIFEQDEDFYR